MNFIIKKLSLRSILVLSGLLYLNTNNELNAFGIIRGTAVRAYNGIKQSPVIFVGGVAAIGALAYFAFQTELVQKYWKRKYTTLTYSGLLSSKHNLFTDAGVLNPSSYNTKPVFLLCNSVNVFEIEKSAVNQKIETIDFLPMKSCGTPQKPYLLNLTTLNICDDKGKEVKIEISGKWVYATLQKAAVTAPAVSPNPNPNPNPNPAPEKNPVATAIIAAITTANPTNEAAFLGALENLTVGDVKDLTTITAKVNSISDNPITKVLLEQASSDLTNTIALGKVLLGKPNTASVKTAIQAVA